VELPAALRTRQRQGRVVLRAPHRPARCRRAHPGQTLPRSAALPQLASHVRHGSLMPEPCLGDGARAPGRWWWPSRRRARGTWGSAPAHRDRRGGQRQLRISGTVMAGRRRCTRRCGCGRRPTSAGPVPGLRAGRAPGAERGDEDRRLGDRPRGGVDDVDAVAGVVNGRRPNRCACRVGNCRDGPDRRPRDIGTSRGAPSRAHNEVVDEQGTQRRGGHRLRGAAGSFIVLGWRREDSTWPARCHSTTTGSSPAS